MTCAKCTRACENLSHMCYTPHWAHNFYFLICVPLFFSAAPMNEWANENARARASSCMYFQTYLLHMNDDYIHNLFVACQSRRKASHKWQKPILKLMPCLKSHWKIKITPRLTAREITKREEKKNAQSHRTMTEWNQFETNEMFRMTIGTRNGSKRPRHLTCICRARKREKKKENIRCWNRWMYWFLF